MEEDFAGNPRLRARVELLLLCDSEKDNFLESDPQKLAMALLPTESEDPLREPREALGDFGD